MNKKEKEALVLALAEKWATYREITKKAGVSPNTIKAVLNRAGLDESTSIRSSLRTLFSTKDTFRSSYIIKSRCWRSDTLPPHLDNKESELIMKLISICWS